MGIECSEKQGAAFYLHNSMWNEGGRLVGYYPRVEIHERSRNLINPPRWGLGEKESDTDLIILFQTTSIVVNEGESVTPGTATWKIYTQAFSQGRNVEAYRGIVTVPNGGNFYVYSSSARRWHVGHTASSFSSLATWRSSLSSTFSRAEFVSGTYPTKRYHISITDSGGMQAYYFNRIGQKLKYSVHCGCNHEDCQQGIFPQKYCCFNCADANRWLREIRDDSEREKHLIQAKLGLPRTYNG